MNNRISSLRQPKRPEPGSAKQRRGVGGRPGAARPRCSAEVPVWGAPDEARGYTDSPDRTNGPGPLRPLGPCRGLAPRPTRIPVQPGPSRDPAGTQPGPSRGYDVPMDPVRSRSVLRAVGIVGGLLLVTTLLVALLEGFIGVENAAMTYLLAVIGSAALLGWAAAAVTAIGAFVAYDVLFIEPRFTVTVADPSEWLTLLLLLVVGMVVAWLTGALRERAETATSREREANALYQLSRVLATRTEVRSALPDLEAILARETGSARAWITVASGYGRERRPTEAASAMDRGLGVSQGVLRHPTLDGRPEWVRLHQSTMTARVAADVVAWRVPIEASGRVLGGVWVERPRTVGSPDPAATQLLSTAADQIGQAMEQDRLVAEARDLEVARQGEALKSALLDSVSHDLRTPLASIRAAAGMLLDPDVPITADERIASATAIDREADNLARLVANLLDLSRIEGGALDTDQEIVRGRGPGRSLPGATPAEAVRPAGQHDRARRPAARPGRCRPVRPGPHEPPGERGQVRPDGRAHRGRRHCRWGR